MITSYALLRRDDEFLSTLDLTYAVLDEAQHIKNPMSATAAAAKRLRAKRRLALTGTPVENRLSEIWSIFDFVSPGLLGALDKFEQRFSRPIEAGDYKTAQRLRATPSIPSSCERAKKEVAKDLPEKIETDQICDLTGDQRAIYMQVAREVKRRKCSVKWSASASPRASSRSSPACKLRQAGVRSAASSASRATSRATRTRGKLVALRELVCSTPSRKAGTQVHRFSASS